MKKNHPLSAILLVMQTLIIHGRQPQIGRAELESLQGPDKLRPVGEKATLLDIDPQEIDFMRLGGMVKFCKVLTVLDTINWGEIEQFLISTTPAHFASLPEGKLKIGLSVYGLKANVRRILATALELKKAGKTAGRSIRIIPNKELALNSAQVLHNKLTQKLGWELVFVRDGDKTILAQSIAVQDIDAYAARDHGRPCRDPRVGMLPPKLAQTLINLAVGPLNVAQQTESSKQLMILDPFCGTGVIAQEATMMGYGAMASDIDPRMVDCTDKNLMWLLGQPKCQVVRPAETLHDPKWRYFSAQQADATSAQWDSFDTIACETYLGRPLSSLPDSNTLQKIVNDCDTIHKKFLQNVARQTQTGFRLCLAVPAWKTKDGFLHLKTLDKLAQLGYNRLKLEHVSDEELIYHRPGQVVARELLLLKRK